MQVARARNGIGDSRIEDLLEALQVAIDDPSILPDLSERLREHLSDTARRQSLRAREARHGQSASSKGSFERTGTFDPAEHPLLRLLETFGRLHMERSAIMEALNCMPIGVILVDRTARPFAMNSTAEIILSQNDGLMERRDGLAGVTYSVTEALRALIDRMAGIAAEQGEYTSSMLGLPRPSGRRSYSVVVSPLFIGTLFGRSEGAAAVFVTDPEIEPNADYESLKQLYGLSPAEARVCMLIAQGKSLHEAADVMGIAVSTVRTHLKRIFSKTHTDRQADLVRLILTGLVHLHSR